MQLPSALSPEALIRPCDPAQFEFETTAEIHDGTEIIGQPRAIAAVELSLGIPSKGYNLFAFGEEGTGKHFLIKRFLERAAADRPAPPDLCYVNNFDEPNKPLLIQLPPGTGQQLREDLRNLVDDVFIALPTVFESEEYASRLQALKDEFQKQPEQPFAALREEAQEPRLHHALHPDRDDVRSIGRREADDLGTVQGTAQGGAGSHRSRLIGPGGETDQPDAPDAGLGTRAAGSHPGTQQGSHRSGDRTPDQGSFRRNIPRSRKPFTFWTA